MEGKPKYYEFLIKSRWPHWFGGVLIAVLNILLTVIYKPWGITGDFTDWGFRVWSSLGGHPENLHAYFQEVSYNSLYKNALYNEDTLLNLGLVFGVLLAVCLAGEFRIKRIKSSRQIILGILGGLLMGYGARLALGCNIGAVIAGISSQSLHGWAFAFFLFFGSLTGSIIVKRYFN